jgi:STE24 endopeptidase
VRRRFASTFLTVAALVAATAVLTLPLTFWTGYVREHAYGMSNQSLGAFLGDWAKGLGVAVPLFALMITAIYAVVRRAPRTWWLWGAGVVALFMVFAMLVVPVFVAPLFNRYQALEPGPLRDEILSMARAHRVPAEEVYWFDASRQTKRISANVSGFAGTLRVSLNDNLLARSPRETVLAVLGHEVGHFVLGHSGEMLLSFALIVLAGFAALHFGFARLAARGGPRWRIEGIADPAGLPLAMALLATFFLLVSPVSNWVVRSNEAEADAFGLAAARQPDGFALAAVQLSEYRKMKPGPLEEILFYDHPSGYDRIRRAMEWKAENLASGHGR